MSNSYYIQGIREELRKEIYLFGEDADEELYLMLESAKKLVLQSFPDVEIPNDIIMVVSSNIEDNELARATYILQRDLPTRPFLFEPYIIIRTTTLKNESKRKVFETILHELIHLIARDNFLKVKYQEGIVETIVEYILIKNGIKKSYFVFHEKKGYIESVYLPFVNEVKVYFGTKKIEISKFAKEYLMVESNFEYFQQFKELLR